MTDLLSVIINDLKSNMDRFIGNSCHPFHLSNIHLKSNMDRFIGAVVACMVKKVNTI